MFNRKITTQHKPLSYNEAFSGVCNATLKNIALKAHAMKQRFLHVSEMVLNANTKRKSINNFSFMFCSARRSNLTFILVEFWFEWCSTLSKGFFLLKVQISSKISLFLK